MSKSQGNYYGAPYNFVPFTKKVLPYPKETLIPHNDTDSDLLTGEIDYTIEARTDIIVDDGSNRFNEDSRKRKAIPGSSIRGLVRGNVQILSLSSVGDDIDDYALMYRNIASGAEHEHYIKDVLGIKQLNIGKNGKSITVSVLSHVKAGYISCEGDEYYIYPTIDVSFEKKYGERNYYILSEKRIAYDYKDSVTTHSGFSYPFFIQKGHWITQNDIDRIPITEEKNDDKTDKDEKGKNKKITYKNKYYHPYALPCSYEAKGQVVYKVGEKGVYKNSGYAVSTGFMNGKKAIYIIPAEGKQEKIKLDESSVKAFKIDFEKKKNALKGYDWCNDPEYFALPKSGAKKPVFYIDYNNKHYFGFTPYLRLFYENTVKHGIPDEHKKTGYDFTKALFGFATENDSYKSRVSFADAVAEENPRSEKTFYSILGEPKPTSYLDYIIPDGLTGKTYNADDFELRGIKQYWLKPKAESSVPDEKLGKAYVSTLNPLSAGTRFHGKIRFSNLDRTELGLLLFGLRLNKDSVQNIGKAKSYGFGSIAVTIDSVRVLDMQNAYSFDEFNLDPFITLDVDDVISGYFESMRTLLGKDVRSMDSVKIFLKMKDPVFMPKVEKIKYMSIDARDYQSREMPLQFPQDLFAKVDAKPKLSADDGGFEGEVVSIDGKKVKVRIMTDSGENVYKKFSCENVTFRQVTKKELSDVFKAGSHVRITIETDAEGNETVKCTELIG